jgi:hypothetical protein
MQILFAAPFIFLAGFVFTVLSLIPRARRWAIPIPTGILAAGPFSSLAIFIGLLVVQSSGAAASSRYPLIAFYTGAAISGLLGGFFTGTITRFVVSVLPAILLRLAVLVAAWCSYSVLIASALFVLAAKGYSRVGGPVVAITISLELLLSFIGAWFVARRWEEFRSSRYRLPRGTRFRDRGNTPDNTGSAIDQSPAGMSAPNGRGEAEDLSVAGLAPPG